MPGFPFGPIRPNTRAGLPLTASVLMPAVRRSLAVRGCAAVALVIGRKGIVTAMATPDARICRRGRRVGFPLSLIGFPLSLNLGGASVSACIPAFNCFVHPHGVRLD